MRNPFAGIFSLFRHTRGDAALGVDFGASALKVVQIKKKEGQAVLETYGSVALSPYAAKGAGKAVRLPNEKLAEALTDVIREAKVTAKECVVAVPMSAALVAAISVPTPRAPNTDVGTLIRLEARKFVPVPLSEVELEWTILSTEGEKTRALITAIHRDALERVRTVVASAGLSLVAYETEVFSLARAITTTPDEMIGIVDIGAASVSICISAGGRVVDAHTFPDGAQNAGGATLERALSETKEVFRHFETERSTPVARVVLVGGGALRPELRAQAEGALGVSVSLADPFAALAAPAFLSSLLREAGPEFAVSTGAARRGLDGK